MLWIDFLLDPKEMKISLCRMCSVRFERNNSNENHLEHGNSLHTNDRKEIMNQ